VAVVNNISVSASNHVEYQAAAIFVKRHQLSKPQLGHPLEATAAIFTPEAHLCKVTSESIVRLGLWFSPLACRTT